MAPGALSTSRTPGSDNSSRFRSKLQRRRRAARPREVGALARPSAAEAAAGDRRPPPARGPLARAQNPDRRALVAPPAPPSAPPERPRPDEHGTAVVVRARGGAAAEARQLVGLEDVDGGAGHRRLGLLHQRLLRARGAPPVGESGAGRGAAAGRGLGVAVLFASHGVAGRARSPLETPARRPHLPSHPLQLPVAHGGRHRRRHKHEGRLGPCGRARRGRGARRCRAHAPRAPRFRDAPGAHSRRICFLTHPPFVLCKPSRYWTTAARSGSEGVPSTGRVSSGFKGTAVAIT
jgi:hypothetical protein